MIGGRLRVINSGIRRSILHGRKHRKCRNRVVLDINLLREILHVSQEGILTLLNAMHLLLTAEIVNRNRRYKRHQWWAHSAALYFDCSKIGDETLDMAFIATPAAWNVKALSLGAARQFLQWLVPHKSLILEIWPTRKSIC